MADWRGITAKNNRKSWLVIAVFFMIYLGFGCLLDFYFNAGLVVSAGFTVVATIVLFVTLFQCNNIALAGSDAKLITIDDVSDAKEKQLLNVVEEMKIAAGITYMPKIYVMEVEYLNAFASGWRPKSCCVAISRPLLNMLTRAELQAVMAHELTHIRNQDTRLLVSVSVMANFLVFVIDILFRGMLYGGRRSRYQSRSGSQASVPVILIVLLLRILLPIITAALILFLSRSREYMADAGAVQLTRRNTSLVSALVKMHAYHRKHYQEVSEAYKNTPHESMRSLSYIYDPKHCGITNWMNVSSWFSTHPKIEDRLMALGLTESEVKSRLSELKPDHK